MADVLASAALHDVSDEIDTVASRATGDRELLVRFLSDGESEAFAELVERYGRTVWGVCRRILQHEQDAEDAFQAVFLVLARKAASIRKGEAVGSWLYGVAYRIAMKARQSAGRRHKHESRARAGASPEPEPVSQAACRELQRLLDAEVERLAEKLRKPFVLCCLEGLSKSEAAQELGWKPGTVSGRLAEARKRLQARLALRGVTLTAILTAGALAENTASAAVPPLLLQSTTKGVLATLAGKAATPLPPSATALAEMITRGMTLAKIKVALLLSVATGLLAMGGGLAAFCLSGDPQVKPIAVQDPETFLSPPAVVGTATDEQVLTTAFSPDGTKVVTAGAWGNLPGQIKMWNRAAAKEIYGVNHVFGVRSVAFAPDGRSFATGDFSGTIRLRDTNTGAELAAMKGHTIGINTVVYADDGTTLLSAGLDKVVKIWDVKLRKERQAFLGHADMVLCAAFFHHSPLIVSGSKDKTARIWDMTTGKEMLILKGNYSGVEAVIVSPDDKTIYTAGWDNTIRIWDVATGKQTARWKANTGSVMALALSPKGDLLASSAADGIIRLWDPKTHKEVANLQKHTSDVRGLDFSRDGKLLVSGSADKTANLWDVASRKHVATLQTSWSASRPVVAIAYAPDGKTLAVATRDGSLQTRDAKSGDVLKVMTGHQGKVNCLACTPDSLTIISGGDDKQIKLWDLATGQLKLTLAGHKGPVRALAITPNGRTLVSGGGDRTIVLWNLDSGKEIGRLEGHSGPIRALAVAPTDKSPDDLLASAGTDGTIKFWSLARKVEVKTIGSHEKAVRALAFSPDGQTLASAGDDGVVKLWDVIEGQGRRVLKGHANQVLALAFSPGGQTLVSAGNEQSIFVWDPFTGQVRTILKAGQNHVSCLAISPLGNDLITGSADTTLLRWRGARMSDAVASQGGRQVPAFAGDIEVGQSKLSYAREFYYEFAGNPQNSPHLQLTGRDADQRVSFDSTGARISLPAGHPGEGPVVGLATRFGLQGDFEITAGYEIVNFPRPADAAGNGTRLSIALSMPTQQPSRARVTRAVRNAGDQFISWANIWDSAARKALNHFLAHPAAEKSGRLRLVRNGAVLSYFAADGPSPEFRLLAQFPALEEPVTQVSLVGQTGGPKSGLEAIFTHLNIRADSFSGLPDTAIPEVQVVAGNAGLLGAGAVLVVILCAATSGVWFFVRRFGQPGSLLPELAAPIEPGAPQAAKPSIVFPCKTCGKNLKVRAALAGRKGNCPHCSGPVVVPSPSATDKMPQASNGVSSVVKRPWCWFLLCLLASTPARAQEHLAIDLRQGLNDKVPMKFFGPDASTVAKFGPDGLRIRLPEGRPDSNPVGLELDLRLQGDFEIATSFQLFALGGPPVPIGLGVQMMLFFDTSTLLKVAITRLRKGPLLNQVKLYEVSGPNGDIFGAARIDTGPEGKEVFDALNVRAQSLAGKLKLARKGSKIEFWVADGNSPYHLIRTKDFVPDDIKSVRLFGFTGYRPVAVDVAFNDLAVDVGRILVPVPPPSIAAANILPQPPRNKVLLPATLAIAGLVTTGVLFSLWVLQYRKAKTMKAQTE